MKPFIDQPLGQAPPLLDTAHAPVSAHSATNTTEVKVHIRLSASDFQRCLPDFINKAISFEVSYNSNDRVNDIIVQKSRVITPSEKSSLSMKDSVVQEIYQKYIVENIEQTPPKDAQIAEEFGISVPTFKNKFKMSYGKTFYQLYMDKKMDYAANLLRKGFKAYEVSTRIGYSQPIKFSMIFKKRFGITPKKFQMQRL